MGWFAVELRIFYMRHMYLLYQEEFVLGSCFDFIDFIGLQKFLIV